MVFKPITKYVLVTSLFYSGIKSIIDNVIRKQVRPKFGSVVYCTLVPPFFEHSGIYVGKNKIVHLNRLGYIEQVSFKEFTMNSPAITIYVSSKNGESVGNVETGLFALSQIGKKLKYHIITENCHKFSSSCLTGNHCNNDYLLSKLQKTSLLTIGANEWRVLVQ